MHRRDLRGLIQPTVREHNVIAHRSIRISTNLLSGADEKLLDVIEPILVSRAFTMSNNIRNCWSPILSTSLRRIRFIPFFELVGTAAPHRPDAAARRPYQFVDFDESNC